MSTAAQRYAALPRAIKWSIWAGVFFVGYFAVLEPVMTWTARKNEAADRIELAMRREHELRTAWSNPNTPAAAARAAFGTPLPPGPIETRSRDLYTRINIILQHHGVLAEITERRSPLRHERADQLVPAGQRIDRFILDLTFDTTPEKATAVIAELEQAPEVAAVGRVQIRRADAGRTGSDDRAVPRRVRVIVSPEAWVTIGGSAGGRS